MDYPPYFPGYGGGVAPDLFIDFGEDEMESWLNYCPGNAAPSQVDSQRQEQQQQQPPLVKEMREEPRGPNFIDAPAEVAAAGPDIDVAPRTGDRKGESQLCSDDVYMDYPPYFPGYDSGGAPNLFIGEDEVESWLNYCPGNAAPSQRQEQQQKPLLMPPLVKEVREEQSRESNSIDAPAAAAATRPDIDVESRTGDRKRKSQLCSDDVSDDRRPKRIRRSHTAEVHNRSERRRRERINQKMRALQELIPRCHKTDKASMLDDAAEYLKSLQLQIKMMSMRGCSVPPMMYSSQLLVPPLEHNANADGGVPSFARHPAATPFAPTMIVNDQQNRQSNFICLQPPATYPQYYNYSLP